MAYIQNREYTFEVAQGNITGEERFHKLGRQSAVGTGGADIWNGTGYKSWATAAEALSIVSTNANDTVAGTRARTVFVDGIGPGWVRQTQTYNLNGTTPVITAETWFRVNCMYVVDAGTYSNIVTCSNQGTITATGNVSGFLMSQIDPFRSQSEQTHFTVPDGKTLYIKKVHITGDVYDGAADNNWNCHFARRLDADVVAAPVRPVRILLDIRNDLNNGDAEWLTCPEKSDNWFIGQADVGTVEIMVNYFGILKDN